MKNENNTKVYYYGDEKRGKEIMQALHDLGGEGNKYGERAYMIYYIDSRGQIQSEISTSDTAQYIKGIYTLATLPTESKEQSKSNIAIQHFNIKDWVIVKGCYDEWKIDIYSHKNNQNKHECMIHQDIADSNILPMEGNQHLLRTKK